MPATAEKASEIYKGDSVGYPWDDKRKEDSEKPDMLQEAPYGDQLPEEKVKTQITKALAEAETKAGEEVVGVESDQPPQKLEINIGSGDGVEKTDSGFEVQADTAKTVPVSVAEPPMENPPIPESRNFEQLPPVSGEPESRAGADQPIESKISPEEEAKKEISATFQNIGQKILKGWREGSNLDDLAGSICYAIEEYRKNTGDKEFDFFSPTIQALDTVSRQLMIVEETEKAGRKVYLKNPEEAQGVYQVALILKDLPLLGSGNRENLREFLHALGEKLDNRREEDITPAI